MIRSSSGGGNVRFGDVITAVAALFLVTILISYPLEIVLVSFLGLGLAPTVGALVSVLLGGLIIGYIFSRKMGNDRTEIILKISILFTVLMIFSIILNSAVLGNYFTDWVHETYQESNPTESLTTFDWFVVGGLFIGSQMFLNVIVLFFSSLVGLYFGSILRRKRG
jgi:hypothetical protein